MFLRVNICDFSTKITLPAHMPPDFHELSLAKKITTFWYDCQESIHKKQDVVGPVDNRPSNTSSTTK